MTRVLPACGTLAMSRFLAVRLNMPRPNRFGDVNKLGAEHPDMAQLVIFPPHDANLSLRMHILFPSVCLGQVQRGGTIVR